MTDPTPRDPSRHATGGGPPTPDQEGRAAPPPPSEGAPARDDTPRRRTSTRARVGLALLVLLLLAAVDLSRPPAEQLSARFLLGGIDLYQATLSQRMPEAGVQCRFTPTCSHYAEGAIRQDGALVGTARAVARIARCGPWTPAGTHDPP